MKIVKSYNENIVDLWEGEIGDLPVRFKPLVDRMSNGELKKEFRQRAADCGGCNRQEDIDDAPTAT